MKSDDHEVQLEIEKLAKAWAEGYYEAGKKTNTVRKYLGGVQSFFKHNGYPLNFKNSVKVVHR